MKVSIIMRIGNEAKLDAFLAIRGLFDPSSKSAALNGMTLIGGDFEDLTAFDSDTRKALTERSRRFAGLNSEQQKIWLTLWRERLRRRGRTMRLDPHVHAEQVAAVLRGETESIRTIIERYLPDEIARKAANILQTEIAQESDERAPDIDDRLVRIVRERFLANFVAYEDLFKPTATDRFTTRELGNFIWRLGITEIARVCRGIEKIESLAGFLQRFDDRAAKEIGGLIPEMKDVAIERIRQAEERIKKMFKSEPVSDDDVRRVGMLVFAESLSSRSDDAVRYSLQKLPVLIAGELQELVNEARLKGGFDEKSVVAEVSGSAESISKGEGR